MPLKAAALLHSLGRHHALVDGNERLSWWTTAGASEVAEIADRLHTVPIE